MKLVKYWDDESNAWIEYEVLWDGELHRRDPVKFSLLGDGWQSKESIVDQAVRAGHDASGLGKVVEQTRKKGTPSPWRAWVEMPEKPVKAVPPVQRAKCRGCGQTYRTRIPEGRRLCGKCTGRTKAA